MSTRKLQVRRRYSKRGKAASRLCMRSDDDVPLSLLNFLEKTPTRGRKLSTPKKRTTRTRAKPTAAETTQSDIINLDDTHESAEILNSVNSKIGNFIQSGSFISSDEDETEMIKAKTNKKSSPSPFFISDDSDDDCNLIKQCSNGSNASNFDTSKPSTSAEFNKNSSNDNNLMSLDDDVMTFVNSVVDEKDKEQTSLHDMKSLEDYRKETEEMLKNASLLLDEIKTGSSKTKCDEKEEKRDSSPKITVGACPICLEPLVNRVASVTVCGHIFCKECIMQTARLSKKCPTCRKAISSKKIHPIYF